MKHTGAGAVAFLSLLLASPLAAQPARELRGQVFHRGENGERISEPGLIVTLVETGATDDTNDQGIFRLPLPPALQSGDSVTISIDKTDWRVRYPLDGETRVPRASEILPVELLPVGSKLFWTHDRIEKFIRDASERSKQEGRREGHAPSLDLGRDIKDWAAKYGFNAQEAREEIDRWIAEVEAAHEDSYQKGLAAFAKQQFDTAAERFRDSAEWRIRQLDEAREQQEKLAEKAERLQEEVVRDLRLQGDSHYYADRFEQALTVYQQAHQYTSKDQTPQLWGATLNDIGRTHLELGIRVAAAEDNLGCALAGQRMLAQELDAGRRAGALGYAIAAGLAMDAADVSDRVEELLGVVAAQPRDFTIPCSFKGTLRLLEGDPEVPHRDLLIRLFQALEAPDRDTLLQGLRAVKAAIRSEERPAS